MSTKATIVKGNLVVEIDVTDLFDSVPAEDRSDLMQRIACEESVIQAVVDQVLTGWTENASSGYDDRTFDPAVDRGHALNVARERLAKGADAAAQLIIERLRRAYRHSRASQMDDWRKARATEDRLREDLSRALHRAQEAEESRDHWQTMASRINAERPAAPTGATT